MNKANQGNINMATSSSSKKNRPPKGYAQLPEWWMEITPHNTLDLEKEAAKRQTDSKETAMFAMLAAKSDWEKKYADCLFLVGDDGELLDKETGKPVPTGEGTGYTRSAKGEWMKDGEPLKVGRQFKPGDIPDGYVPGGSDPTHLAGNAIIGTVELKSTAGYGHKDMNWKKPDWMQVKLRSTGGGDNIRQGDYTHHEGKITMATQREYGKVGGPEPEEADEMIDEEIIEEYVIEEEVIEEEVVVDDER